MYNALFLFIIFSSAIDSVIPGLNYWDEALLFAIPFFYICKDRKIILPRSHVPDVILILILVAAGLMGNILHPGLQEYGIAIFKDIIALLKFPVLAIALDRPRNASKQSKITHEAAKLSRIIVYTMLLVAIIGYFIDIGVYQDEIRIVRCYRFFFSHPTFLVATLVFMAAIIIADSFFTHKFDLFIIMILLFLSGRTKAYIIIFVLLFLMCLSQFVDKKKILQIGQKLKVRKRYIIGGSIVISCIAYVIAKDKIAQYLSYGLFAARPALYIVGIQLMIRFFPFGSGFGTFASSISGEYYSNVYRMYHIDHVNGMTQDKYNYIGDTFFPYIYGQFGVIGMLAYLMFCIRIVKNHFSQLKSYKKVFSFILLWIYAAEASVVEAFFTNSTAVQFALILFIFLGKDEKSTEYTNIGGK